MSTIAIITARGGSKRIPHKNIKPFMEKPMLAYAIQAALKSKIFDEVMVSTDSTQIAAVALKYGAKVPFMRSAETANDFATTVDVLNEVVTNYEKRGKHFDTICCLYPCVPLLAPKTLQAAFEKFQTTGANALMPVVAYSFPIQRAVHLNRQGFLEYREPNNAAKRSQDLERMYHDVGMFYLIKTDAFKKYKTLVCPKTALYEMDERMIQDIDTMEDWKMAEMKYKILKRNMGR